MDSNNCVSWNHSISHTDQSSTLSNIHAKFHLNVSNLSTGFFFLVVLFWYSWGKKGFILAYNSLPLMKANQSGNSRQELEAETEAETTEDCCLVVCSLWLAQPAFYKPKTHRPLSPSIINQGIFPLCCPLAGLRKAFSQRRFPPPR